MFKNAGRKRYVTFSNMEIFTQYNKVNKNE
jgi:hypothetical protein